jgi:hypothetical protein
MIGVDFQADASKTVSISHLRGSRTANSLSEQYIGTPMNQTIGLTRTLIMRHTRNEKVITRLREFNAELGYGGILVDALEKLDIWGAVPYAHC